MKEAENTWDNLINDKLSKKRTRLSRPTPINREIIFDKNLVLLSITDNKGIIEYCNDDFVEISGYEEYELAGFPHNIVRHPDMPKTIFKLMWSRIQNKENVIAIIKNMSKTGRYYWVYTDFIVKEDEQGNIIGYKAYRKAAPRKAIETMIPIYKKLKDIEDVKGVDIAEKFLHGYLDGIGTYYDKFVENLIIDNLPKKEEVLIKAKINNSINSITNNNNITTEKTKISNSVDNISEKQKKAIERKSFFKRMFGY